KWRVPLRGGADGGHQVPWLAVFEQVADRAHGQRVSHARLVGEGGEHHDLGRDRPPAAFTPHTRCRSPTTLRRRPVVKELSPLPGGQDNLGEPGGQNNMEVLWASDSTPGNCRTRAMRLRRTDRTCGSCCNSPVGEWRTSSWGPAWSPARWPTIRWTRSGTSWAAPARCGGAKEPGSRRCRCGRGHAYQFRPAHISSSAAAAAFRWPPWA